jgi:hypothetical protein
MKSDDPLGEALSKLPVPPASRVARERALHRATIALRQSLGCTDGRGSVALSSAVEARRRFSSKWGFIGALAMVMALAAAAFWRFDTTSQPQAIGAWSMKTDRMVLGQIEALFGSQLNAVVERAGAAPDIRLSEGSDGGAGHAQPLLIEFMRGADLIRVLGYSGRAVCVDLAGRRVCFEPLATGDGNVILAGDNFCWTPQDHDSQLSGYHVTATLLPNS